MRLLEVLTRTRLQVFTFPQGTMANGGMPDGAGSGFILLHKGNRILVTADHVCHPEDYQPGLQRRVFEDKDVGIVNNYNLIEEDGGAIPIITPIGGFYYFETFKFSAENGFENFKPYDSTFAILGDDRFQYPFLSEPLYVANGPDVPGGKPMIFVPSENIIDPSDKDRYIVYGHTNHRLAANKVHLEWDVNHHEDMVYVDDNGDYYVLRPNESIEDSEWSGISGAPVFNQDGGLLGVLCGGYSKLGLILVMKARSVLSVIDKTLRIREIENEMSGIGGK